VDQRGLAGALRAQAQGDRVDERRRAEEREDRDEASGPFLTAESLDRGRDPPVDERRLRVVGELGGEPRVDPVARLEHLQRDGRVATFVGLPDPARALEGEREDGQREQAQEGAPARADS
jgi:hypothetical protein